MASPKLKTALEVHAQLTMRAAVRAVREMGWRMRETTVAYGINRQTLDNRLNDRHTGSHAKQPKTSPHEEDALEDLLLSCTDTGIPLKRQNCAAAIIEMNTRLGLIHTAFEDQQSRRFLKRHPRLSLRITHANNRKKEREWTHELAERYIVKLTELHNGGFLDEPDQVWNLDESAFKTAEMYGRVVGRKGMRQVLRRFSYKGQNAQEYRLKNIRQ